MDEKAEIPNQESEQPRHSLLFLLVHSGERKSTDVIHLLLLSLVSVFYFIWFRLSTLSSVHYIN